jgi:hypothetical protein
MIRFVEKQLRSAFYFNEDELAREFNVPVQTIALVCRQLHIEGQIEYQPPTSIWSSNSSAMLPINEWRKMYGPRNKTNDH